MKATKSRRSLASGRRRCFSLPYSTQLRCVGLPPVLLQMKCEHCTRKECSKKSKTDDQEDVSTDVSSPAQENEEASKHFSLCQPNKCDTSKHRVLVVSVCPQSLPYFAAKFNLRVHYVFDTTIAADFSILESQKEFVRRYHQHSEEHRELPMLTSACPGWVRYAERVLGPPVIPHLCTAKSPQQVMGSLVKDYFARQQNLSPEKIFHVVVAPCYDKKLEALREGLSTTLNGARGTDCVLTSGEIAQIMEQSDFSVKDTAVDTLFGDVKEVAVRRHDGVSSDGHLAHVFRHAAKELFGEHVEEITYPYGFRNIQNMILKLKKGKFPYHFVEVLACPRGCLNGRGQAQREDGHTDRALLRQMEGIYSSIPVRPPESSAHVQELYQEWLEGTESPKVQEVLHTTYQSLEPCTDSLDIKW
ncbi:hypothetical protein A6R68_00496 [Neotoma lepida]|uniref:Iron hydrogenase small subunit domain-containing protein n=1 Tax=Neotoma lepida TaxID=56216 RepID=A0A1A6GYE4_NEOLE|nr:hypothetical protein A6R68_00496 [Neotoma lepida]